MCFICDGNSYEDLERVIELSILTHGWYVQSVLPASAQDHHDPEELEDGPGWSYTIGITEGFNLPELIVIGLDHRTAMEFLNTCGDLLTAGMSLDELGELGIDSHNVHETHLNGELFFRWSEYYQRSGSAARVIQLVPPRSVFCACCYPMIPDLSDPDEPFPHRQPWADAA